MGLESILTDSTVLKFLEVKIEDFVVLQDEIVSLEVKYNFFDPRVKGTIKIKDSFDMGGSGLVKITNNNKITISSMDRGGTKSFRTFRVTNSNAVTVNDRTKMYDIQFQDDITWSLDNMYIEGSINGSAARKLYTMFETPYMLSLIRADKITVEITDTAEKRSFTIPKNQTFLETMIYLLRKDNIRFYQDRNTIYIKEVKPSQYKPIINDATNKDLVFTDDVQENSYLFKIHDSLDLKNDTGKVNKLSPIIKVNSTTSPKGQSTLTISLPDFFEDLKLNDMELGSIQLTSGEKLETSEELAIGWQKAKLFDTFMLNQQMYIAVKGTYKYSNVGTVITIKKKGSVTSAKSNLEGDRLTSGKYFVFGVSDRYLGDKLIQRLHIGRLDAQKVKEVT